MIYAIKIGGDFSIDGLYIQTANGKRILGIILVRPNPIFPSHMEYICWQYELNVNMQLIKDEGCPEMDFDMVLYASNHFVQDIQTNFRILATSWKKQLHQEWNYFYALVISPLVLSTVIIIVSSLVLKQIKQRRLDEYQNKFLPNNLGQGLINSEVSGGSNFDKIYKESLYTD